METYRYRILCVDDDPGTLKSRKLLLEDAGYFVLTASSGQEVLDILSEIGEVDLVLLDFSMGGMNGDILAKRLRDEYPDLPLVAVSAREELPEPFLRSVNGHVRKGQNPEILLSTISDVLAKSARKHRPPQSSAGTVMCVDDEQLQLQLRTLLFESAGFKVLQARSASTALELFRSQRIDAVVMDYWLSGTNGTAVAEEMKKLHPEIPIVMLSGYSSLPGEGAVVDAWLRKAQVEPEEIVNVVKKLIGFQADKRQSSNPD
ncbi:MAG: response regulator [Candidatus Sulfotelmatobacter sp.]